MRSLGGVVYDEKQEKFSNYNYKKFKDLVVMGRDIAEGHRDGIDDQNADCDN